jgi:hypothetical protein
MANYYSDSTEWKWHFKNAIDWDKIIPLYYPSFPTEDGFNSKEDVMQFIEELITATGEWSAGAVADRARRLDHEGAGEVKDGVTIPGEALSQFYVASCGTSSRYKIWWYGRTCNNRTFCIYSNEQGMYFFCNSAWILHFDH